MMHWNWICSVGEGTLIVLLHVIGAGVMAHASASALAMSF
jgi:hypothetical protein